VLPPSLIAAIASLDGRVALVIGAGTSVEDPTGIAASRATSAAAHRVLIERGILVEGDCDTPDDLAKLADVVVQKRGSQAELVAALPVDKFRTSNPNRGHLLAAALLMEGAVSAIVTLNFDLALPHAIARVGGRGEISVVQGPEDQARLGVKAIVFLHRNAYAADDRWILTTQALTEAWRGGWIVSTRPSTSSI
jgi:hypothetical protein